MKKISSILPIAFITFVSCEKTIKVNPPGHAPKLVVESNTPAGAPFMIKLSKTVPVLAYRSQDNYSVSDATVILHEDNLPVDTLEYDILSESYHSTHLAVPGRTYQLKMTAPGVPEAFAGSIVPTSVPVTEVIRTKEARIFNGETQDELKIRFEDPAAAGDYYIIAINPVFIFTPFPHDTRCVYSTDASIEYFNDEFIDIYTCIESNAIFISDKLFNGTTKEVSIFTNSDNLIPSTDSAGNAIFPTVLLYHVTEDYFRYRKSHQYVMNNEGNPFSEPAGVHTNIRNGYGIFSIMSADIKEIR